MRIGKKERREGERRKEGLKERRSEVKMERREGEKKRGGEKERGKEREYE